MQPALNAFSLDTTAVFMYFILNEEEIAVRDR